METKLEELQAMLTEVEFNSRFSILEAYHVIGETILAVPKEERQDLIKSIAYHTKKRVKKIEYMARFAQQFPKLDSRLNEGKNISWEVICAKYLREPKDQENCDHEPVAVCRICRKVII